MKTEEQPLPMGLGFQADFFGKVIISQRALGEYSASATNVLSVHLFILHFTSKFLVPREERKERAQCVGAGRALESTQCSHLLLHEEKQTCRGQGACMRPCGKAGRELSLDPDLVQCFFSNFCCIRSREP